MQKKARLGPGGLFDFQLLFGEINRPSKCLILDEFTKT